MIYGIVEEQDETHIKIGYASSKNEDIDAQAAVRRVKQYQTGNRRDLYVVCGVPGTVGDEKKLHKQFARQWEGGEWFTVDAQVKAWIDSCRLAAPVRVRKQKTPRMIQEAIASVVVVPVRKRPPLGRIACLSCEGYLVACTCKRPRFVELRSGGWIWNGKARGQFRIVDDAEAAEWTRAPRPIAVAPSKVVRELDELAQLSRDIKARNQNQAANQSPYAKASARCWWPTGKAG